MICLWQRLCFCWKVKNVNIQIIFAREYGSNFVVHHLPKHIYYHCWLLCLASWILLMLIVAWCVLWLWYSRFTLPHVIVLPAPLIAAWHHILYHWISPFDCRLRIRSSDWLLCFMSLCSMHCKFRIVYRYIIVLFARSDWLLCLLILTTLHKWSHTTYCRTSVFFTCIL